MATELSRQAIEADPGPQTITLDRQPDAGNTIVLAVGGGTIIAPAGFLRVGQYGGGNQDASIWYRHADGTETSVSFTEGGAGDTVVGALIQYQETLTPIGVGSNNGHGAIPDVTSDFHIPAPALTVDQSALMVAIWSTQQDIAFGPGNEFTRLGPSGGLVFSGARQGGPGIPVIAAVGVADVSATGAYPRDAGAGNYALTTVYQHGTLCYVSAAAFADPSGVPSVPAPANPVVGVNQLPGMDESRWYLNDKGIDATIAGYAKQVSALPGDTVECCVDSTGNPFEVVVTRLGWNGNDNFSGWNPLGNGSASITGTVVSQPLPDEDATLGHTTCAAWTPNVSWTLPEDLPTGVYQLMFRRTDVAGHAATAHLTVRDASVAGKVAVVLPFITFGAYSRWGGTGDTKVGGFTGRSLYGAGSDGPNENILHRAYGGTFDAPISTQADHPVTYVFDAIFGLINLAEMLGWDLTYLTDVDVHRDPTILTGARAVIVAGHHEYWSKEVRDGITAARDAGVNVWFTSANTAGWRVRFDPTDTGLRTWICYKESMTRDVGPGWAGTGYDPDETWTGAWRDTVAANGKINIDQFYEAGLTGQRFVASGPIQSTRTFRFADKVIPMFRHSDGIQALAEGQTLADASPNVGYEVDSANGGLGQPANLAILTSTDVTVTTGANDAGDIYDTAATYASNWTIYRADSGALVVNTGWRGLIWSAGRWRGGDAREPTVNLDNQAAFAALGYDIGIVPATPGNVLQPGNDAAIPDPSIGAPADGDPAHNNTVALAYGLTATAQLDAAATLSATPTLSAATPAIQRTGGAALASVPELAALADPAQAPAAAMLAAAPTLTVAAPGVRAPGTASMATTPTLAASVDPIQAPGAAVLASTPELAAPAPGVHPPASAALSSAPALLATAPGSASGAAALSSAPALSALADPVAAPASAPLVCTPAVGAAATAQAPGAVMLSSAPTLVAAGVAQVVASATLSSAPVLAGAASARSVASVVLVATPVLIAGTARQRPALIGLASVPGFGAHPPTRQRQGVAVVATTPRLAAGAAVDHPGAAALFSAPSLAASASQGPPGFVSLSAAGSLTLAQAMAILAASLNLDWGLAPPRWRFTVLTGIRTLDLDREAVDYVQLYASTPPDDAQVLTRGVRFAFTSADDAAARPGDADWHTGEWFPTPTRLIARVLIGPGVLPLAPDVYQIWVRLDGGATDASDRPFARAGHLRIS